MQHLLLLHGAIGAKDQLQPLCEALKNDYIVHSLNFSGHGGKPMPEIFSIEFFANDILNYLEENNIERINILGYSMGGYVAMYFAKHYPEKVNKIFTLATKFLWTPEIAQRETEMLNPDKIEEKLPLFARTLEQRHLPNDWKIILKKTADMMRELGNMDRLQMTTFISIEKKILIGIGDKDTMVTLEESIDMYRKLKNASLIVLPDTTHPIEKNSIQRLTYEAKHFFID